MFSVVFNNLFRLLQKFYVEIYNDWIFYVKKMLKFDVTFNKSFWTSLKSRKT